MVFSSFFINLNSRNGSQDGSKAKTRQILHIFKCFVYRLDNTLLTHSSAIGIFKKIKKYPQVVKSQIRLKCFIQKNVGLEKSYCPIQVSSLPVGNARPNISQFLGLKIRGSSFPKCIKFAKFQKNCDRVGRVLLLAECIPSVYSQLKRLDGKGGDMIIKTVFSACSLVYS